MENSELTLSGKGERDAVSPGVPRSLHRCRRNGSRGVKMEERMSIVKRIGTLAVVLCAASFAVSAQANGAGSASGSAGSSKELSVEESYLQQSVELMIIREQVQSNNRDMKMVALEYIGDAIKSGRGGPEIEKSLEFQIKS